MGGIYKQIKTMKKLKLKTLQFGATELLTRAQLRNVLGGFMFDGSPSGSVNTTGCARGEAPCTINGVDMGCRKPINCV